MTPQSIREGKWTALAILFLVGAVNYVDRTILSILQVPIKAELGLSDAQLGSLTGIGFALIYTTSALPIARITDRSRRTRVIAAVVLVWSLMTLGCGLATSFVGLLLFRMGVAAGEAGSLPASHSLLSDFFAPGKRATAISIWNLSVPFGIMFGFLAGGFLANELGWRQAFFAVGSLGFLLAPLVLLGLKEPQRGRLDPAPSPPPPPLREAVAHLWNLKSFRLMLIGAALHAYVLYTMSSWNAPFYARVHHLELPQIASALALLNGLGGGVGIYLGGFLADRWGRRDPAGYLYIPLIGTLLMLPCAAAQYLAPSSALSIAFAVLPAALGFFYSAPILAVGQSLVPASMRAFTSAVIALVVNLFGMGLGPAVTGLISDWLVRDLGLGETSLRYAICTSLVCLPLAALFFWRAARHLRREFVHQ